MPELPYLP